MFKVNSRNTSVKYEIYSRLTIKTPTSKTDWVKLSGEIFL